jgi:mannose-1-phosphate guanylyltransferase/mannose-6-phosphate isomerase
MPGNYIFIPKGSKHRLINISNSENLIISEVQLGDSFDEDDIVRYEDQYGRKN